MALVGLAAVGRAAGVVHEITSRDELFEIAAGCAYPDGAYCGDTVKLTRSMLLYDAASNPLPLNIPDDGELTIDLNNNKIQCRGAGVVNVGMFAMLTVTDTSAKGQGSISINKHLDRELSPVSCGIGSALEVLGGSVEAGLGEVPAVKCGDAGWVRVAGSGKITGVTAAVLMGRRSEIEISETGVVSGAPAFRVENARQQAEIVMDGGRLVNPSNLLDRADGAVVSVAKGALCSFVLKGGAIESYSHPFWNEGALTLTMAPEGDCVLARTGDYVDWTVVKGGMTGEVGLGMKFGGDYNSLVSAVSPCLAADVELVRKAGTILGVSYCCETVPVGQKTYSIAYCAGEYATGDDMTMTKPAGGQVRLLGAGRFKSLRAGFEHEGWSTDPDGSTKAYDLLATYAADASVTLYPYWVDKRTGWERLKDAFDNATGEGGTYVLADDVEAPVNGQLVLKEGKKLEVNLNGHSIVFQSNIPIVNGGTLTFSNTGIVSRAKCHVCFVESASGKKNDWILIKNCEGRELTISGGYFDAGYVSPTGSGDILGGDNVCVEALGGSRVTLGGTGHLSGWRGISCEGDGVSVYVVGGASISGHVDTKGNAGICLYFDSGASNAYVGKGGSMDCEGSLVYAQAEAKGSYVALQGANVQSWRYQWPIVLAEGSSVVMEETSYTQTNGDKNPTVSCIANPGGGLKVYSGCRFSKISSSSFASDFLEQGFLLQKATDENNAWVTVKDERAPDFALAPYFMNDMVLQRNAKNAIWGKGAVKGLDIRIELREMANPSRLVASSTLSADEVSSGDWVADIQLYDAVSTPLLLTVTCGSTSVQRTGVLVGDVWLCGGQSNMRVLEGIADEPVKDETIRHCAISPTGRILFPGLGWGWSGSYTSWRKSYELYRDPDSNANTDGLAAMPYEFARALRNRLGTSVPIGLVNISRGGMPTVYYLKPESAAGDGELINFMSHEVVCYQGMDPDGSKYNAGYTGCLWDPMVPPIALATFKGCIWYQGESDASTSLNSSQYFNPLTSTGTFTQTYKRMIMALARQVRSTFGKDLPFYFVQIASWKTASQSDVDGLGFSAVREGMRLATKEIAAPSGMAAVYDLTGVASNYAHPDNKKETAARLAAAVLHDVYGCSDVEVRKGAEAVTAYANDAQTATIAFDTVGKGLVAGTIDADGFSGPATEAAPKTVNGFQVSADGRGWVDAKSATITDTGDKVVVVASTSNCTPLNYIRYAYCDSPCGLSVCNPGTPSSAYYVRERAPCNLYCKTEKAAGKSACLLPALPFASIKVVADPLPEKLPTSLTTAEVSEILAKSPLSKFIVQAAEYNRFRSWVDGRDISHPDAWSEPSAYFSYLTDQDSVVTLAEDKNPIRILDGFAVTDTNVACTAEIAGVDFGASPSSYTSELKKMFGMEAAVGSMNFEASNFRINLSLPNRINYTIVFPSKKPKTFFFRSTVKPEAYGHNDKVN